MNPLLKLENEMIETKIKEGKEGLAFLLEYANPDDDDKYDFLLKQAGVEYESDNTDSLENFIKDSFHMDPDHFYDKYRVNFWISRDANLTTLSKSINNMNEPNKDYMIGLYAERFL
ncbi:hypothetical protein WKW47_07125 [Staphylococcus nepalensis]|uniref:hypothetical protein n=1 Tax=Staphylococcus nepalensis TaxID=214473 RepID=UPI003F49B24B